MNTAKHTPTPWVVSAYLNHNGNKVVSIITKDANPAEICNLLPTEAPDWSATANAAFIVRAVNAHEAMLEALEEAKLALYQAWVMSTDMGDKPLITHCSKAQLAARAAIAKAKGEQ